VSYIKIILEIAANKKTLPGWLIRSLAISEYFASTRGILIVEEKYVSIAYC